MRSKWERWRLSPQTILRGAPRKSRSWAWQCCASQIAFASSRYLSCGRLFPSPNQCWAVCKVLCCNHNLWAHSVRSGIHLNFLAFACFFFRRKGSSFACATWKYAYLWGLAASHTFQEKECPCLCPHRICLVANSHSWDQINYNFK